MIPLLEGNGDTNALKPKEYSLAWGKRTHLPTSDLVQEAQPRMMKRDYALDESMKLYTGEKEERCFMTPPTPFIS